MNTKRKNLKFCVYCHTNKVNGKKYIGQTCDVIDRWRCNGKNYFSSLKFFNAIKKYGWDNFEHVILYENLTLEEANKVEAELIEKYNTIENGYNIKPGGENSTMSEESKKKMSETLKRGYIEHPERKEKISKAKKGSHMSEEHRKKISDANKGRPHITHQIKVIFNGTVYNKATFSKALGFKNTGKIDCFIKKFGFEFFQSFINKYKDLSTLQKDLDIISPKIGGKREVVQLDLNGKFIKKWSSAAQIQIETRNLWIYKILDSEDGSDGKFIWRYKTNVKSNK